MGVVKIEKLEQLVTCFCPECEEESFEVAVTDCGTGQCEMITMYWFEGEGVCSECGYKGSFSDTSV